jgi:hypothetical protein
LDFNQYKIQTRKRGLANSYASLIGARNDRKVTPGITELSRLRAHSEQRLSCSQANRRRGLLHRCRLFLSWPCRSGQGWGCSPIKRDRELGSERCEAVCLISTGNVRCLRGRILQYERNEGSWPLVYRLSDKVRRAATPCVDKS